MSKIIIIFIIMFILLLTPILIQTYTSYNQATAYREMIDSMVYANQLNSDVNTKIEPIVWQIVAGKVKFEDSGIMLLISDIRLRMIDISNNTLSAENRGIMEVSLRALNTLEDYLGKLKAQIDSRAPVAENEKVYEEIILCVAGINDLLQTFSSEQLMDVDVLNQEVSKRSNQTFIMNILMALIVFLFGIFAFLYISKALIKKSIAEEKQLQMLEYKTHQAQVSPHFLYNTLDAIIWAAEEKDMAKVITLVSSLSSFFRISLSHGIDFISISDEITHVKNYLAIQKIRYSDVLSYEINVDDGIGEQKILKLLLQPLVENSLYHGIKGTRERGKIAINVKKCDGKIRFSVTDNGIGIHKDKLEALKREISEDTCSNNSYGLFSVNRRLKLYYGLAEDITINSEYKKGTEVSFILDIL